MEPWQRDLGIALIILLVGGYIRYVLADVKSSISKNAEDIEENDKAISDGKKELYEHGEKMYYTKETMDAKIIALKYRIDRGDDRGSDRGSDPYATL